MTTREIVSSIVEKVGYGHDAAKGMSSRERANLLYQTKIIGRVVKSGDSETARRSLAQEKSGDAHA